MILTRVCAERVTHFRSNPVEDTLTFQAAIRHATGIYYPRIANAPTSAFIAARKALSPGFYEPQPVSEHLRSSAPQKPYRQQSLPHPANRLRTRLLSKMPLFFFEAYQEKLACDWTNDDDWQAIVGLAVENVRMAMRGRGCGCGSRSAPDPSKGGVGNWAYGGRWCGLLAVIAGEGVRWLWRRAGDV